MGSGRTQVLSQRLRGMELVEMQLCSEGLARPLGKQVRYGDSLATTWLAFRCSLLILSKWEVALALTPRGNPPRTYPVISHY